MTPPSPKPVTLRRAVATVGRGGRQVRSTRIVGHYATTAAALRDYAARPELHASDCAIYAGRTWKVGLPSAGKLAAAVPCEDCCKDRACCPGHAAGSRS